MQSYQKAQKEEIKDEAQRQITEEFNGDSGSPGTKIDKEPGITSQTENLNKGFGGVGEGQESAFRDFPCD